MYEGGTAFSGGLGHCAWCFRVDAVGEVGFAFGFVYSGVGSGVDDERGAEGLDGVSDRSQIS